MILTTLSLGAESVKNSKAKISRVMTWVPPYATNICLYRLNESFGGMGMKNGLTHLGLQFWRPSEKGKIQLVGDFQPIDDASIIQFRKWGDTHKVQILLCVYNGYKDGWNWDLAKNAFDTHRKQFIATLVSETVRLQLDGVDIDFEGKGTRQEDKKAFFEFIKELSFALKGKGKELTVDSFAYKWNAPNQGWWKMMLPYIDALHVMGYSETGLKSAGWRSYDFLKAAAGNYSSKLLLGVPSHASDWENKSVEKHLEWVVKDKSVGLAIWDAQLKDTKWRTREVWQTISRIKQGSVLKEIDAHSFNDEEQLDVRSGTSQIYLNRY